MSRLLSGAEDVEHFARFAEGEVEPLLAFEPMQREVITTADFFEVGTQIGAFGHAEPTPRAIAEVGDSRRFVDVSTGERSRALEGVIVVFENDVHAVLLEEWAPMLALILARAGRR